MLSFQEFPKIPCYRREVAITEKIDGTNAAVAWHKLEPDKINWAAQDPNVIAVSPLVDQHGTDLGVHALLAQSRSRFITPGKDNYGFAKWVAQNAEELKVLGPGVHYGEWWGYGIQRGYGLPEKRFSLFNVARWGVGKQRLPECCHVVPLMGYVQPSQIEEYLNQLKTYGSIAAPGYMRPEGIIVWHSQSKQYYKILIENDEIPKGVAERKAQVQRDIADQLQA